MEIARINKDHRDTTLPGRLAEALGRACSSRVDVSELTHAAWTIFAELIDNVFSHSRTLGSFGIRVKSGHICRAVKKHLLNNRLFVSAGGPFENLPAVPQVVQPECPEMAPPTNGDRANVLNGLGDEFPRPQR